MGRRSTDPRDDPIRRRQQKCLTRRRTSLFGSRLASEVPHAERATTSVRSRPGGERLRHTAIGPAVALLTTLDSLVTLPPHAVNNGPEAARSKFHGRLLFPVSCLPLMPSRPVPPLPEKFPGSGLRQLVFAPRQLQADVRVVFGEACHIVTITE